MCSGEVDIHIYSQFYSYFFGDLIFSFWNRSVLFGKRTALYWNQTFILGTGHKIFVILLVQFQKRMVWSLKRTVWFLKRTAHIPKNNNPAPKKNNLVPKKNSPVPKKTAMSHFSYTNHYYAAIFDLCAKEKKVVGFSWTWFWEKLFLVIPFEYLDP